MNIKDLFPLKGNVTEEILQNKNLYNTEDCTGARTLKAALSKAGVNINDFDIRWGTHTGTISRSGKEIIVTSTFNMMRVEKPLEVTIEFEEEILY